MKFDTTVHIYFITLENFRVHIRQKDKTHKNKYYVFSDPTFSRKPETDSEELMQVSRSDYHNFCLIFYLFSIATLIHVNLKTKHSVTIYEIR